jgi:long-chain acyl-CoA synthetase
VTAPLAERITAADSERDQRHVAGSLRARGLGSGDRVALVAGPSATYLAAVLGALRSGVVPVLLHPGLTDREERALLADAEPALVLRDDDLPALIAGTEVELAPVPLARPMMYTSGTTGTPKGVWSGVLDETDATALVRDEQEVWGFARDDVLLVLSPLHHSAPIRFATGTLLAGGEVVLATPFDAARVAHAIADERPTVAFATPAHLQRLFDLAQLPALDSFRLLAHAGAPCGDAVKRRALELFPAGSVWEFYGSTEGQFTACSSDEWLARPGTVGRARPGRELVIEGGEGGAQGIVWCRVPRHARFEYWRDPVKTAAAWDGDAFTVRDVGRLDADGYLYLDGRRDDLIISGGVNVYPLEVERVILEHPGVRDAAVFGVADERWGQRVCAAVVGDVDRDELDGFLRERLARYKHPKTIVSVDAIPVSVTGKVRRHELDGLLYDPRSTGGDL